LFVDAVRGYVPLDRPWAVNLVGSAPPDSTSPWRSDQCHQLLSPLFGARVSSDRQGRRYPL